MEFITIHVDRMRWRLPRSVYSGKKIHQSLSLLPRFNQARFGAQAVKYSWEGNGGIGSKIIPKSPDIGVLDPKVKLGLRRVEKKPFARSASAT